MEKEKMKVYQAKNTQKISPNKYFKISLIFYSILIWRHLKTFLVLNK